MTETEDLPIRRRVIAVAAMSIGSLMLMIDASIASVVLPTIASELGVEGASTMLLWPLYQLRLARPLLPWAAIGDRLGYRRLYQAGFALHTLAAFLCLFVNSLPALILVRGLQSRGAAPALAVAGAMLRTICPPHRL